MWGGASRACRKIQIVGTEGEIDGDLHAGVFAIRRHDPEAPGAHREEVVDVKELDPDSTTGHGGGDQRLMAPSSRGSAGARRRWRARGSRTR